jgi:hypothetical protein
LEKQKNKSLSSVQSLYDAEFASEFHADSSTNAVLRAIQEMHSQAGVSNKDIEE